MHQSIYCAEYSVYLLNMKYYHCISYSSLWIHILNRRFGVQLDLQDSVSHTNFSRNRLSICGATSKYSVIRKQYSL